MRRKLPNKSEGAGNKLEDGFFKTLLDSMQISVIVSNAEGKPGKFAPAHHGTMFPDSDLAL
jgi:hypothetical protein